METIKLLHIADVHIGAPFQFLGRRGGEQRLALREALARVALIAREERYHLLVIAGDLFDSAYEASDADVSKITAKGQAGIYHQTGDERHYYDDFYIYVGILPVIEQHYRRLRT